MTGMEQEDVKARTSWKTSILEEDAEDSFVVVSASYREAIDLDRPDGHTFVSRTVNLDRNEK